MDRADARTSQHRDRSFGNGRQINNDAIALADFVSLQNVCEPAYFSVQLLVSERSLFARLAFPQNCGLVAAVGGEMSIQAVLGKIEFSADEPFRKRRFPFQDFSPRLLPGKLLRLARPEFVRPLDRLAIHSLVLREVLDPRFLGEILGRLEDALLL